MLSNIYVIVIIFVYIKIGMGMYENTQRIKSHLYYEPEHGAQITRAKIKVHVLCLLGVATSILNSYVWKNVSSFNVLIALITMFAPTILLVFAFIKDEIPIIFSLIDTQRKTDENKIKLEEVMLLQEKYEEICSHIESPKRAVTIVANGELKKGEYYMFLKNNSLCFIRKHDLPFNIVVSKEIYDFTTFEIKIGNIEYFSDDGQVYYEQKISGGGGTGGGSSIKGAVVGGVIAGGAGAIIGSRKEIKIEEIKSETIKKDDRKVFLNYLKNEDRKSLYFKFKDLNNFRDLLPQKEFAIASSINNEKLLVEERKNIEFKTITEQIRELAVLKEEGIISEEEFLNKKKELLNKI